MGEEKKKEEEEEEEGRMLTSKALTHLPRLR